MYICMRLVARMSKQASINFSRPDHTHVFLSLLLIRTIGKNAIVEHALRHKRLISCAYLVYIVRVYHFICVCIREAGWNNMMSQIPLIAHNSLLRAKYSTIRTPSILFDGHRISARSQVHKRSAVGFKKRKVLWTGAALDLIKLTIKGECVK